MAVKTASVLGRSSKLTLTFGVLNIPIPIRYKPLNETERPVAAKLMCPEHGATLTQGYTCSVGTSHEHKIERDQIVKGYPHPDDPSHLVVVETSVLEEFAESRSSDAKIERIVDFSTIEPAYLDKVYLVDAGEGPNAEATFDLLASFLREQGKAAVTSAVISKQTRTIVFRWSEEFGCLLAHVCRFRSQIRLADVEKVQAVRERREEPQKEALGMVAEMLSAVEGEFDPGEVEDEYTPLVQSAIRQAAQGGTITATKTEKKVASSAGDLMATLAASLEAAKATQTKPRARKKSAASS